MRSFHKIKPDKTWFFHFRKPPIGEAKANTTVAVIQLGGCISLGIAVCCKRDHFNRKFGNAVALARAKQAMSRGGISGVSNPDAETVLGWAESAAGVRVGIRVGRENQ